jgi:hypothetical protein
MARETIASLKERLEKAQETVAAHDRALREAGKAKDVAEARVRVLEGENNDLRDRLMTLSLENERMKGYLDRAAEDEPQAPITPTVERRYSRPPVTEYSYSGDMHTYRPRGGDPVKQWWHR